MQDVLTFTLEANEFFFGMIRQPDGPGEKVVVKSTGSRDAVVKHTLRAAAERNWDWVIELRTIEDDDTSTTVVHWSSLQGEVPPGIRNKVPELNKP